MSGANNLAANAEESVVGRKHGRNMLGARDAVKGGAAGKTPVPPAAGHATNAPLTRFSCIFTPTLGAIVQALTAHQPNRRNLCTETQCLRGNGLSHMTTLRFSALAACLLASIAMAKAESRTFIIDSSEGYGVDSCLVKGEACGQAMATAVCKSHAYASAADFGRLDPTEVTGSVPGGMKASACQGGKCAEKVAITCTR